MTLIASAASEAIFEINRPPLSARSDALIAIKRPSIGCVDCFDGSDRPKTARKQGRDAAPRERSLHARQKRERSGGATENRQNRQKPLLISAAPKPEAML
jgi:hypothetical protein